MIARWTSDFKLQDLDEVETWDGIPAKPGIYVVISGRRIPRFAGNDRNGILYVGKSLVVKNRVWAFGKIRHPASGLFWQFPKLAATVFGRSGRTRRTAEYLVGDLHVRIATPIPRGRLDEAERAVLFAYFKRYQELPPLNSSFPERWSKPPKAGLRRWAERGIA